MKKEKIFVQKYGGSSVANPEKIKNVASRVIECKKNGNSVVVVVSAPGDTTDDLLALASEITKRPAKREMDMLLATGEQISIALLAMALHEKGVEAISFTGSQVGIITDSDHTKAKILDVSTSRIKKELEKGKVVIVAGFQGTNLKNEITTLGRGGSDMTAVALAKVLKANMCEIFTDVEGVFTADPRVVPDARKLKEISYDEMLEMASLGAQVMQSRSMEVASKFNVPMKIRSSFSREDGTVIIREVKDMEDVLVRGITSNKKEAKVTILGVSDKPGEASKIFEALAKSDVNVDMIIQSVHAEDSRADMAFTVTRTDVKRAVEITKKIAQALKAEEVVCDTGVAKISIVGVGMISQPGVAARMFEVLSKNNINIEMISTSEIKISCVIKDIYGKKALQLLHDKFGLSKKK